MGYGPLNVLTDREIRTKGGGLHANDGGLYLQVAKAKVKTAHENRRLVAHGSSDFGTANATARWGSARLRLYPSRRREQAAEARRLREGGARTPSRLNASSGPP